MRLSCIKVSTVYVPNGRGLCEKLIFLSINHNELVYTVAFYKTGKLTFGYIRQYPEIEIGLERE